MFYERKRDRDLKIEISPLIDVVFLLLIFFMVTTTFVDQLGLDLKLPESASSYEGKKETNVIWVDKGGKIFLGGEEVPLERLEERLRESLAESERKEVVIKADERGAYGTVFRVIEIAQKSGAKSLTAVGTDKKE